jgi:hypothetical protein
MVGGARKRVSVVRATSNLWDVLPLPEARRAGESVARRAGVASRDRFWAQRARRNGPIPVGRSRSRSTGCRTDRCRRAGSPLDASISVDSIDVWVPELASDGAVDVIGRLRSGRTVADALARAAGAAKRDRRRRLWSSEASSPTSRSNSTISRRLLAAAAVLVIITQPPMSRLPVVACDPRRTRRPLVSRLARRRHSCVAGRRRHLVISLAGCLLARSVAYWTASALPALLYTEDGRGCSSHRRCADCNRRPAATPRVMMFCALAPLAQIRRWAR